MRKRSKEFEWYLIRFGLRIKELRKDRGMTQKALSNLTGISVSSISRIENGKQGPFLDLIEILALVFDVKLSELFYGVD